MTSRYRITQSPKYINLRFLLNIVCYLSPALIIVFIWLPVIDHYHVSNSDITDETVNRARLVPNDTTLDEIKGFFQTPDSNSKQLVTAAEKLLNGQIQFPGCPTIQISMPFDINDIDKGPKRWQLYLASFKVPDLLMRAYQVTGRDDFLMTAKDVILGWASYERKAWLPKGFLWNDHAISARISVLAKFWKLYRNHACYDPDVAQDMLQMVARSGQMLLKPSHFTFSTNHGIMQNLALLQICIAFPSLPTAAQFRHLALERMRDQMTFYINNEGVVLEHSAGYQKAGLEFISMAFRYLTLMNMPIPEEWQAKYAKAKTFYAQLRRPDGSLPMFGDTHGGGDSCGPLVTNIDASGRSSRLDYKKKWIPMHSNSLYSGGGYSIWWDGLDEWPDEQRLNQTVVAWSHFPGHAHKHTDEMSVLLWAGGQAWWTNVGYWHYGNEARSQAVSWAGSNAPHLVDENADSLRNTKLKFHGWSEHLAAIDLERKGPRQYVVRRQVIQLRPSLWIVIDHSLGKENDRTTTTWTTSHNVQMRPGKIPGSYILKAEENRANLTKFILGSEGTKIMQFRGSLSPFAGWADNTPASAIVVDQPANNSWAVAIWSIRNGAIGPTVRFKGLPSMENWKDAENWHIMIPFASGLMMISREGDRICVMGNIGGGRGPKELILSESQQISKELTEIYNGYENAQTKYPRKEYSMNRHLRATYALFLMFLLQEAFFLIYTRIDGKRCTALRGLSSLAWITLGIWLFMAYL